MLPPAWTPGLLRTPEFRLQTAAIAACLTALLASPLLALLPRWTPALFVTALSTATLYFTIIQFSRVLPAIEALYNQDIQHGWGFWLLPVGVILLAASTLALAFTQAPSLNVTSRSTAPLG